MNQSLEIFSRGSRRSIGGAAMSTFAKVVGALKNGAATTIGIVVCSIASVPLLADDTRPPLINSDVIKLVKAKLPESTIVMTIQTRPSNFDTSPESLIALKNNGVSTSVLEAMLQASAKPAAIQVPAAGATKGATSAPSATVPGVVASLWGTKQSRVEVDRVFMLEGDKRIEMKFTRAGTRTRHIFASVQQFATLGGLKARLRTNNRVPELEMILPNNVEVSSVVALGLLGERENGSREIMIGGGYMSMSQGLPKDRNIQITYDKTADQTEAPEGYEIYRIKPTAPLKPGGEYAFMVSKNTGRAMGAFSGAEANYNFYELGID
jgi:hypothetical protein